MTLCDFCGDPSPRWRYVADYIGIAGGPAPVQLNDPVWLACETCKDLIAAGEIEGLSERAVDETVRKSGMVVTETEKRILRAQIYGVHKLFETTLRGPPTPFREKV